MQWTYFSNLNSHSDLVRTTPHFCNGGPTLELHIKCEIKILFEGWNWFDKNNYELIEEVEYFEELQVDED
jgi:hypothetical protein